MTHCAKGCSWSKFLSTPSARRATVWLRKTQGMGDISIHALREEGDAVAPHSKRVRVPISIHALREEGDSAETASRTAISNISIHALREEGDPMRNIF